MKQSKTYKLIFTMAMALFMMLSCLFFFSAKPVSADDIKNFTGTYKEAKYEDESAVFTVGNNKTVVFSNWLIANELALELQLGDDIEGFTVSFETDSYDVNGNIDSQGEVYTTVKHSLAVKFDGTPVSFNQTTGTTTLDSVDRESLMVYFTVENNVVNAAVKDKTQKVASADNKYLASDIGGCVAKNVTITANLKTGTSESTVAIKSIDQNFLDTTGAYKQTFELEEGNIKTFAKARITVNQSAYVATQSGYQLRVYKGTQYGYTFTAYSVLETIKSTDLYVDEAAHLWLSNEDKPTTVIFKEAGNKTLSVRDAETVYETFTFVVSDKDTVVNTAPVYKDATLVEDQIESYKVALQEATLKDYNGTKYCVRLGEKVKLPSLENFVCDDYTSYGQLKYTVYYRTPDTTSTTTKMEITTDKAGRYEFFVVFEDVNGEKMSSDDFYTFDDNDEQNRIMGVYGAYVFSFEIQDNAPINITAVNQINGYVGTRYTVSKFNVSATGYTPTYELYYNADATKLPVGDWESTWVKIPVATEYDENDVLPQELTENGFTYEDIQEINYDGQLSFTPDRTGKFVIKCTVSSNVSVRSATATASVEVKDAPTVVKPVNTFLRDNVWSVVFLSAGTVCLIIVIILLFVQPKEKIEEED